MLLASAGCGGAAPTKAGATPGYRFPALTGRVVDRANVLPAADEAAIAVQSATLERRTGHQLVVVTVPSLGGHSIEDYARTLGNHWGIGRRKVDDGVVMVVAPAERKVRIAVGCGLETTLRDAEAQAIIDRDMVPAFRRGRFAAGVRAGVGDIVHELSPPTRKAA